MDLNLITDKLAHNKSVFHALFSGINRQQIGWRPVPEKWSYLEVVCHLLDEEREDFRLRIDYTLHRPGEPWPPNDPPGWVISRNYAGQNFNKTSQAFLQERVKSIAWLKGLKNPDWQSSYDHPKAGKISAEQLLANWLAHDYLHIRQLNRMNYLYLREISQPLSLDYAGDW